MEPKIYEPMVFKAARDKRLLDLDFATLSDDDAARIIRTVESSITDDPGMGDFLRTSWRERSRVGVDFKRHKTFLPGEDVFSRLGETVGSVAGSIARPLASGAANVLQWGSRPFSFVQPLLNKIEPEEIGTPEASPLLRNQPTLVPQITPGLTPTNLVQPGTIRPSQPTLPETLEKASKLYLPSIAKELIGTAASPLGVASILGGEVALPAKLAAKVGGDTAFKAIGNLMAKGLAAPVQAVARPAVVALDKIVPSITEDARSLGALFFRPPALREARRTLERSTLMESSEIQQFVERFVENTTPQDRAKIMAATQAMQEEKRSLLMQRALEARRTPFPGIEVSGDAPESVLNQVIPQYVELKNNIVRKFASELPQDIRDTITREARAKGYEMLNDEQASVATSILDRFETMANRQIAAAKDPEAARKAFSVLEGVYIPDTYLSKELQITRAISPGVSSRSITQDLTRMKERTLTTFVIKKKSGVIELPEFPVMKGLVQEDFDSNVAEFYKTVHDNSDLSSAMMRFPGWVQLEGRKYGSLDGMYVHPAANHEIKSALVVRNNLEGAMAKYADWWKRAVTVWNPPVHLANLVSNVILGDFGGVDPVFDFPTIVRGVVSYAGGKDSEFKAIKATGLVGGADLRSKETKLFLNKALKNYADYKGNDGASAAFSLAHDLITNGPGEFPVNTVMDRLYNAEEELSKYIVAYKAYTKGIPTHGIVKGSAVDAANHAERWLFNYSDVPVGFRELRSGVVGLLGAPFITFSLKVAPRMVEGALTQPWKFLKYKALFDGFNNANRVAVGMSRDEYEEFRRLRAQDVPEGFMRDIAEMAPWMIFPIPRDAEGNAWAMNLARFTPWGQIFQPRGLPFFGAGPIPAAAGAIIGGRDAFGRKLFNLDATAPELPVTPSIGARQASAAAQILAIPPLVRRAIIGALSASGPKWTPMAPTNFPAKALELMLSTGARSAQGTRQGPLRQVISAVIGSPEQANVPYLRERADLARVRALRASEEQTRVDALRRMRAILNP